MGPKKKSSKRSVSPIRRAGRPTKRSKPLPQADSPEEEVQDNLVRSGQDGGEDSPTVQTHDESDSSGSEESNLSELAVDVFSGKPDEGLSECERVNRDLHKNIVDCVKQLFLSSVFPIGDIITTSRFVINDPPGTTGSSDELLHNPRRGELPHGRQERVICSLRADPNRNMLLASDPKTIGTLITRFLEQKAFFSGGGDCCELQELSLLADAVLEQLCYVARDSAIGNNGDARKEILNHIVVGQFEDEFDQELIDLFDDTPVKEVPELDRDEASSSSEREGEKENPDADRTPTEPDHKEHGNTNPDDKKGSRGKKRGGKEKADAPPPPHRDIITQALGYNPKTVGSGDKPAIIPRKPNPTSDNSGGEGLPSDNLVQENPRGNDSSNNSSRNINPAGDRSWSVEMDRGGRRTSHPSVNPNVLVNLVDIPTMKTFTPGKPDHAALLKYVRQCENLKQDLRILAWPRELVGAIGLHYRLKFCMDGQRHPSGHPRRERDWKYYATRDLRILLEQMMPDSAHGTSSEDKFHDFAAYLAQNPLLMDWAIRGKPEQHPVLSQSVEIMNRYERFLDEIQPLTPSEEERQTLIKSLRVGVKHIHSSNEGKNLVNTKIQTYLAKEKDFLTAVRIIQDVLFTELRLIDRAAIYDMPREPSKSDKTKSGKRGYSNESKPSTSSSDNPPPKSKKARSKDARPLCWGCGWALKKKGEGSKPTCPRGPNGCKDDSRRNKANLPWKESEVGKKWAEKGYPSLPKSKDTTLANAKQGYWVPSEGEHTCINQYCDDLINFSDSLIDFSVVTQPQRKRRRAADKAREDIAPPSPSGRLLLDSGAIGRCVMSKSFFNNLRSNRANCIVSKNNYNLVSAFNKSFYKSNKEISLQIKLNSNSGDNKNSVVMLDVTAIVANINIDLILDRETIIKNNLVFHFPNHFAAGGLLRQLLDSKPPAPIETKADMPTTIPSTPSQDKLDSHAQASLNAIISEEDKREMEMYNKIVEFFKHKPPDLEVAWINQLRVEANKPRAAFKKQQKRLRYRQRRANRGLREAWDDWVARTNEPTKRGSDPTPLKVNQYTVYLATLASNFSRKPAFEREGNLTEIPDNKLESIPAELLSDIQDEAEYTNVQVQGQPLLQQELRKLIKEFKDIFRATVQGTPAKLTPFQLDVDDTQWYTRANRLNIRSMDRERSVALQEIINTLLAHEIIEPCDDSHYSHAFLVPKPNGKWRLVLDFKNLNKATRNYYKWPLPDIKEMLNRIGDSRPRFFAVFDLTSGYYQAPIGKESRKYTAFATRRGVYRWRRLPMGLTGAGSYFQHSLSTQVLQGLLHHGVELYLDDCMVHANTLEEYISRLRDVFLRFRNSSITLNPSKCKLGLTQVEYVGHTVDENGLHFTQSKLDSVINFPRPETKKRLKSFLGLANYFRDHIRNHSDRVKALQDIVANYSTQHSSHKVQWNPERVTAFEDIRQAIADCPKLWFLDEHSPIFLQTDASDYGIGAYLYQKVEQEDGSIVEHPVGFVSKAIASAHTSWDTPMKEGYAIFYALKKWEYLLRDRQFTILTDHKNLTQLRTDHYQSNKMVKRWFMAYQEYDILEWGYRKGEDNEVPDTLSRLCEKEVDEHPAVHLFQLTGSKIPVDSWDIIQRYHNSLERGHGGIQRTLDRLTADGHSWPKMHSHVRRFIKLCPCCQKMSQLKKVIHAYPFTTSSYGLWDTVSVDYIERLIPDKFGNNMIIVIIDNFSRFTDMYPVNSTNAEGAADALLSFAGRYATPLNFCTDKGASFANTIVDGLIERLGADHHLTTAYSKEQNAIVERQNKEVLRHLRNIVFDKRIADKWSKYLPLVQRIINASVNSSTGVAPAEVVFPNGLVLDKELVTEKNPIYMSSYISDMQQAQGKIIAICESNLRAKDEKHIEDYPEERTVFDAGTYVLAEHRHNSLRRGPKSKLLPFLKGPMLVKSHNNEGIYILQDLVTQRLAEYHVSKLRQFEYDPRTLTPLQTAVTDLPDEFVVQECLSMRGDPRKRKSQLEFKIRWAGYGPEDDTWEPWEYVRDSDAVQTYLYQHPNPRVNRLLPKGYVPPEQRGDDISVEDNAEESDNNL